MDYTARAYLEGYELGKQLARQCFGGRKVNINYTPKRDVLRIVKLDHGGLMNVGGRSLPF